MGVGVVDYSTEGVVEAKLAHLGYSSMRMKSPRWKQRVEVVAPVVSQKELEEIQELRGVSVPQLVQLMLPSPWFGSRRMT